jgi:prolipoprotein diacylglyceryl transferase
MHLLASIPSPPESGFHLGPLYFHFYGIMYVLAVAAAILVSRWRWRRIGGNPSLPGELALWAFPAGLIGGRIYFLITTPSQMPDHWWGPFAIWDGGLGIWGGVAAGAAVGIWRARRVMPREDVLRLADCVAPALLVAQAIGRIGNYFNQELFGKPTTLPWALEISPAHRPPGYLHYATFQPSFLYELLFDLALAAFLIWLADRRRVRVRAPGIFALYVAGYSGYRIFEETIRIDYSQYILGMRLNFWIASILTALALAVFVAIQRRWGIFANFSAERGMVTAAGRVAGLKPAAGISPAGTAPAGTAPAGSAPAGSAPAGTAPAGTAAAGRRAGKATRG